MYVYDVCQHIKKKRLGCVCSRCSTHVIRTKFNYSGAYEYLRSLLQYCAAVRQDYIGLLDHIVGRMALAAVPNHRMFVVVVVVILERC